MKYVNIVINKQKAHKMREKGRIFYFIVIYAWQHEQEQQQQQQKYGRCAKKDD